MSRELLRYLITSGVLTAVMLAIVQFGLRWLENRRDRKVQEKADAEADERGDDDRDAATYDALKATLSAHLSWDYMIINRMTADERLINELRTAAGLSPIAFEPIPDPPSLRPLRPSH